MSADGVTYNPVTSVTGASGWNQSVALPAQTGQRYVKVHFSARTGTDYRLQELQVWGTNDLHYTLPPAPAAAGRRHAVPDRRQLAASRAPSTSAARAKTSRPPPAPRRPTSWLPATVPGTVLTSYLKAGAIVDPAFSDYQTQISDSFFTESDWWYTDSFTIPAVAAGQAHVAELPGDQLEGRRLPQRPPARYRGPLDRGRRL